MIRKLESLEIKDGKIILKVRAKGRLRSRIAGRQEGGPGRGRGLGARQETASPRPNRPEGRSRPKVDQPEARLSPPTSSLAEARSNRRLTSTTEDAGID